MVKRIFKCFTLLTVFCIAFSSVSLLAKTTSKSKPNQNKQEVIVKQPVKIDTVIVEMKGAQITKADINNRISKIPAMYQNRYKTVDGQKQVIEAMLQEELFYQEALAYGVDKEEIVINQLKNNIKPLYSEKYYKKEISDNVKITEDQVQKYYQDNSGVFKVPPSIKIKHIQVENEENANLVKNELNQSISFDSLIVKFSSNKYSKEKQGIISNIKHNQYITGIGKDTALDSLIYVAPIHKENEFSFIKSETGYHFFQKIEHINETLKPFKDVKGEIENQLKFKEEQKLYEGLISKLKVEYNVQVDDAYIDRTDFTMINPNDASENSHIVINSSNSELVYNSQRIFDVLRQKYQMEKANIQDPKIRKSIINKELELTLIYLDAMKKSYNELFKNDEDVIQMKRSTFLRFHYQKEIIDKASFTEEDILQYYQENSKSFTERGYREIRQFVFDNEKDALKIKKQVEKLLKKNKEDKIIELVKKNSSYKDKDGVLTPVYQNGIMPFYGNDKEYNDRVFTVKSGEVSDVFKNIKEEYVFFYITKEIPEKVKTIEELRTSLENNVRRRNAQKRFDDAIAAYKVKYNVVEHFDRLAPQVSVNELFNMAEMAQKQNNYRDAVMYYDQIIKDYQNNIDDYKAWFMKAFIYSEDLKDSQKALQLYQEMLIKWPQGDLNDSARFMIETLTGEIDPSSIITE